MITLLSQDSGVNTYLRTNQKRNIYEWSPKTFTRKFFNVMAARGDS